MWYCLSLKHNIKGVSGRKQAYTYTKLHNRKEKLVWLVRPVGHHPAGQWRHHRAVPYRIAPCPHHQVTSSDWSNMCSCWNTRIWLVDTSVPYRIAPWHMRTTIQWRHHRSLPYLSPVTASHRGPTIHSTQSRHHCYGLTVAIAANFEELHILSCTSEAEGKYFLKNLWAIFSSILLIHWNQLPIFFRWDDGSIP